MSAREGREQERERGRERARAEVSESRVARRGGKVELASNRLSSSGTPTHSDIKLVVRSLLHSYKLLGP